MSQYNYYVFCWSYDVLRFLIKESYCYSHLQSFHGHNTVQCSQLTRLDVNQCHAIYSKFHRILSQYGGVCESFRTELITKYRLTTIHTHWEATYVVMAEKLTKLTHKMATQLYLVADSCVICSSRSRWPVRKLLDTPSYVYNILPRVSPLFLFRCRINCEANYV
jgi:hypothetical protein